jgi:hypothetical protein
LESIGDMTRIPCRSDKSGRGASRYSYRYPEQETKLKTGDSCIRIDTLEKIQDLEIDEDEHCVTFLSGPRNSPLFLKTTWRMHPDVCRFISDAVYDSRLEPEMANSLQRLILGRDVHPLLKPTGIRFVAADHDACSQRSEEEAGIVSELYRNLLKQRYKDKKGKTHRICLRLPVGDGLADNGQPLDRRTDSEDGLCGSHASKGTAVYSLLFQGTNLSTDYYLNQRTFMTHPCKFV